MGAENHRLPAWWLRGPLSVLTLALFVIAGPTAEATAQRDVFATTTTYEVFGGTSRIAMDPPHTSILDEYLVHSDAVVRHHGRHVFVINRLFADNVLVLDATADYAVVGQYSVTGTGLNPRDLEVVGPGRAYVTLYEENVILVCEPTTGTVLGTIDLSTFADTDGRVEMDQMVRVGDRVFVALQALDRSVVPWAVTGGSVLAVIDSTDDTLIDVDPQAPGVQGIPLQAQNPYWRLRFDGRLGRILMVGSGSYAARDGGLEVINPFTLRSEGLMLREIEIEGELLDFALVDDSTGWALINDPQFDTCLLRFDPADGSVVETVLCTNGFLLSDIELSGDGRLFVSDRTANAPGVRVLDATTGAAIAGPLDTGLPPFDLVLVEGIPTDAPPATALRARLDAAPNPFNPRVELRLESYVAPQADSPPRLRVMDARGRQVRELEPDHLDIGATIYRWDGTDDRGRPAASGTYRAFVVGAEEISTSVTLLR